MTLYRLTLTLQSPLGTPIVGPTLFGMICQILCEREGETALECWLDDPDKIWRISDGFPHGCLPKPLVTPRPLKPDEFDRIKKRKNCPWIRRSSWIKLRHAWLESDLQDEDFAADPTHIARIAHNVVDRNSGRTLDRGGLFFLDEDWQFSSDIGQIDLYIESCCDPDRIQSLISTVGEYGYGRDASTGRGRFRVEKNIVVDHEIADFPSAKRKMSLSRGVLTPSSMKEAYWRVEPHFGRVGPNLTLLGESPFKRPVLLTRPGATFRHQGSKTLGRWVKDLHPNRPEIGLNGFHLAIPFSEASE